MNKAERRQFQESLEKAAAAARPFFDEIAALAARAISAFEETPLLPLDPVEQHPDLPGLYGIFPRPSISRLDTLAPFVLSMAEEDLPVYLGVAREGEATLRQRISLHAEWFEQARGLESRWFVVKCLPATGVGAMQRDWLIEHYGYPPLNWCNFAEITEDQLDQESGCTLLVERSSFERSEPRYPAELTADRPGHS